MPEPVTIAVVGSGVMGRGIAEVAVLAGHRVLLADAEPAAVSDAVRHVNDRLSRLKARDGSPQRGPRPPGRRCPAYRTRPPRPPAPTWWSRR